MRVVGYIALGIALVMAAAAGLALKDHGRGRTLKGLSAPGTVST